MTPESRIDITPDASELWQGIAGYFDSLSQVLSEFVDNSISNFKGRSTAQRSIRILLDEQPTGRVRVAIEDTGTGIADLRPGLRLGDKSAADTPMNEHGFGLKHALASAEPTNTNWRVLTRTRAEFDAGEYREVKAPYSFAIAVARRREAAGERWPGAFNGSGTLIEFECSRELFDTLQRGVGGVAGFQRCLDYLVEDLGYVYAGVIRSGHATITVVANGGAYNRPVAAVLPEYAGFYTPGNGEATVSLAEGSTTRFTYEFGEMKESTYTRRYKRNMATSGVEVRINGRLMADNLFAEIWGIERHNMYNHFLVRIDLLGADLRSLPRTRTSKTAIRPDDPLLVGLFEWIRRTCPQPHKKLTKSVREDELVKELETSFNTFIADPTRHIEREFEVFKNYGAPLPADLYVFDGRAVRLFEAKKDNADVQAVYQLVMYWDGLVADGGTPNEGIVVASSFSEGVRRVVDYFNAKTDGAGNPYRLSTTTWREQRVQYPPD